MEIIIANDYKQLSRKGYEIIKQVITDKKDAVLGLATGSTPIGIYAELVKGYNQGELSFDKVCTVNLDEYVGLGEENEQSYVSFMWQQLFGKVNINGANVHLPNGKADDLEAETARYNALLAQLQQDIQLLGIGGNGHIGFNEPNTPFDSLTHIVALTANTIKDNSRFFADPSEVPTQAITMGIANILNARKILIVASGSAKAQAVYDMVKGEISPSCPASALRLHDNVTVLLDRDAAKLL